MPRGVPNHPPETMTAPPIAEGDLETMAIRDQMASLAAKLPASSVEAPKQADNWADPNWALGRLSQVFLGHYPEFRPNYGDVQVMMACVYGISVRGVLSFGQIKSVEAIIRRAKLKGVVL